MLAACDVSSGGPTMGAQEIFEKFAVWADIVSLLLLVFCLSLGGLTPSRLVWGRSLHHNLSLSFVMGISFLWSVLRFVVEGIYETPGPREFLAGNVVYLGRWIYLWWKMNCADSKEARMFAVARALREVRTLRIGFSTDKSRAGDLEVVLRRGVQKTPPGEAYWRGVKIKQEEFHELPATWEVHLAEEELHSDTLEVFGTTEYMNGDQGSMNAAYRAFYDVVMSAVAYRSLRPGEEPNAPVDSTDGHFILPIGTPNTRSNDATQFVRPKTSVNGTAEPNFDPFFSRWSGLPVEWVAQSVGAIDQRPIGYVARRVAADAIVYIKSKGKTAKTIEQVKVMNACLERALAAHLTGSSRPSHTVLNM